MAYPHQPDHITLVITHSVLPEKLPDYEHWLKEVKEDAARFTGYQSTNVLRPVHGETTFTLLIRFDNLDTLYGWIQSDQRDNREAALAGLLAGREYIEIRAKS